MAIRRIDPGLGDGKTGMDEWTRESNTDANFQDPANAASKLVGKTKGRIPLAEEVMEATFSTTPTRISVESPAVDVDSFAPGSWIVLNSTTCLTAFENAPFKYYPQILTMNGFNGNKIQLAFPYSGTSVDTVYFRFSSSNGKYTNPWTPIAYTKQTYDTTTATGANVVVGTDGTLMRSTSSERYKNILSPLVLTDEVYNNAISLKPIVYRSTAEADNPAHHYYSFSAEELGKFDKAFTLWNYKGTKENEKGEIEEYDLEEPQAEGININALLAFTHAINRKQDDLIKKLEERIKVLENQLIK